MSGRDKNDCGAESAGSGTSDGSAAEFDPLAETDDDPTPVRGTRSVSIGRPVGDAEFRALKERARTRSGATDPAAQEDGHGHGGKEGSG